jgi:hypothetical protein
MEVKSILQVDFINQRFRGMLLHEVLIKRPSIKVYETSSELTSDMPIKFDVRNWGFFLVLDGKTPDGAGTVV